MDGHVYLDHNPWTAQSGIYRDCQHKGRVERVGVKCTRTLVSARDLNTRHRTYSSKFQYSSAITKDRILFTFSMGSQCNARQNKKE